VSRLSTALAFWTATLAVIVADVVTKALALAFLWPRYVPHDVLGDAVRLTLAYNQGMAFGIPVGGPSRVILASVAVGILVVLARLYRATPPGHVPRALALGLVCGGAVGNLIDRVRSPDGVIDFIDIGVGDVRFWTFNVADLGVTAGACLLALVLWREGRKAAVAA
jgi:signal peptidase II